MKNERLDISDLARGYRQEMDPDSLVRSIADRLKYTLAKDEYTATRRDLFFSLAYAIRDRLISRWIETQQEYYNRDVKRVYYLSMEFLIGRTLGNSMINLGIWNECVAALQRLGYDLEELRELEWDAGLGNGGLGRLAACFMDSMATQQLPAYGYGIRYEYGIFHQKIMDGYQVERPDNWLRYGNPWEIGRPEFLYPVKFYGRINQYTDHDGWLHNEWVDADYVMAMAYDTPIPGYRTNTVNTLRLWSAKSTREFNLEYFNSGDYIRAVEMKNESENISKVLYPSESTYQGRELRLKQEYFFVSATLQDIMRRYDKMHSSYDEFPDKVAIQLNDTHPAIAIPELMRLLVDGQRLPWEKAWDITTRVFAYTNHTILPEALERWRAELLGEVLPRHLQIIHEINRRFLNQVYCQYPGDTDRARRMSLVEEGDTKRIRMANLAIVGSHSVNGVSELHTDILKSRIFRDFNEMMPRKFNSKTNGITQRRWLALSNRRLAGLITETIGEGWLTDLYEMKKLVPYADDADFRRRWDEVKSRNKKDFATGLSRFYGIAINPDSLFDFHVKRIHEYKRQLLNVLHVVHLYDRIRNNPDADILPRTVFFSGKAAPGYATAKLIVKLINSVANIVNNDPAMGDRLKVIFLPNYRVTVAQRLMPAADLSEQISTAGTEASGTGNMKFALNGALTIGTLDGANVEIRQEVGQENIFIFGLTAAEVQELKEGGYDPLAVYHECEEVRRAIDMIAGGIFSPEEPDLFRPLIDGLLKGGDPYCLLADFTAFRQCQRQVAETYRDRDRWTRMAILNVAHMGKFSSDCTIRAYAREIWQVEPVPIEAVDTTSVAGSEAAKENE